nr:hypothetical protein [Tanacetum cinerariifolium]
MDSIILLGQMNTLVEYMILPGADNRPPMLDKDLYDSWKNRMELFMQNRENKRMILESVEHGPLIWLTVEENSVIRTKKYAELSAAERIQADCDMKATNIILQGLPTDIYSLVNHHRVAKDLWERVQLLMQDLDTSNFNQLHAYLEQHELHANEVRIMREGNQDQHAFIVNQQMTNLIQSFIHSTWINSTQSPLLILLSNTNSIQSFIHFTITYISVLNESSNLNCSISNSTSCISITQAPTQLMTGLPFVDSDFVVPVFSPGDDPIACLNKAMAFLIAVASSRFPSTSNQLRTSSNTRN